MLQTDVFCTAPQTEGMPSHLTTSSTHHPHPLHPHAPTPPLRQNNLTSVTFKSPPSSLVNVHSLKYTLHATQIRHTRKNISCLLCICIYYMYMLIPDLLLMCFPDTHWMDFLLHQSITHQMQMSCTVIASKGIYNNISAAQKSLMYTCVYRSLLLPDKAGATSSHIQYASPQHHNVPTSLKKQLSKGKDSLLLPHIKDQG